MKSFESDLGLNYDQSKQKCINMGASLAQPYNKMELMTLTTALTPKYNTLNSTSFWIGKLTPNLHNLICLSYAPFCIIIRGIII